MSDNGKPSINVTRGPRERKRKSRSKKDTSGSLFPNPLALVSGAVQRARQLWWAGLGVLSLAEDAGTKVFDALVEEGKSWEEAQRERRKQTAKRVEELSKEGTEAVEAVEKRVREEVNAALHRVGVPRRDNIDELRAQIDTLADRMDELAEIIEKRANDT